MRARILNRTRTHLAACLLRSSVWLAERLVPGVTEAAVDADQDRPTGPTRRLTRKERRAVARQLSRGVRAEI
jgi:hypothetical protein